jgi:hypothetical protein
MRGLNLAWPRKKRSRTVFVGSHEDKLSRIPAMHIGERAETSCRAAAASRGRARKGPKNGRLHATAYRAASAAGHGEGGAADAPGG